jgi:hypothetical protein
VPAHLLQLGDDLVAGHVALEDEEGDAVVAALVGRLAGADQEVGADAVGDEGLGAVHHVAAVDFLGGGSQGGHVGPCARLRDPERADQLAPDPGDEPALLLLLGAELPDRRHGDLGVRSDAGRDAAAAARARELLDPDGVVHVVAPLAAVLGLELEAQEAELTAAVVELAGKLARLLPLLDVRGDLLSDEAPHRLAQLLVLLRERRQQRPLPSVLYDGDGGLQSSSIV